jgi:hypothetical protein
MDALVIAITGGLLLVTDHMPTGIPRRPERPAHQARLIAPQPNAATPLRSTATDRATVGGSGMADPCQCSFDSPSICESAARVRQCGAAAYPAGFNGEIDAFSGDEIRFEVNGNRQIN